MQESVLSFHHVSLRLELRPAGLAVGGFAHGAFMPLPALYDLLNIKSCSQLGDYLTHLFFFFFLFKHFSCFKTVFINGVVLEDLECIKLWI